MCVRASVCVCARARAHACVRACVCACVYVLNMEGTWVMCLFANTVLTSSIDDRVSDGLQWLSDRFPRTTFATLRMLHRFGKCLAPSLVELVIAVLKSVSDVTSS